MSERMRRGAYSHRRQVRDVLPLLAAALAFGLLLGRRLDYLGHFLAGYGGTMTVLTMVAWRGGRRIRWSGVLLVVAAIIVGAGAEATVFRLAIFDPVDFANQSLGACLAGAAMVGRRGSPRLLVEAVVLGISALGAGFWFAFA